MLEQSLYSKVSEQLVTNAMSNDQCPRLVFGRSIDLSLTVNPAQLSCTAGLAVINIAFAWRAESAWLPKR